MSLSMDLVVREVEITVSVNRVEIYLKFICRRGVRIELVFRGCVLCRVL